jgi:hypothetical protein
MVTFVEDILMKHARKRAAALTLGAFMLGGGACDDEEGCSVDPLGEIRISNGSEQVVHAIGSFHTVAFGTDRLESLIYDTSGTHQVDFYLNDGKDHNQELMVFDLWWDEPIVAFNPLAHYYPLHNVHYKTVPAGNTLSYGLGASMYGTGHVIRQHRGLCRISVPWQEIFGLLSDEFLSSLAAEEDIDIAERLGENMQASYVGRNTDIRHGFTWEGLYNLKVKGVWHVDLWLNAGYSLKVREADGLVSVANLHARTDAFDGMMGATGKIEPKVRAALQTRVPEAIEQAMTERANVAIPFSQNSCTLADPIESQQGSCYDATVNSGTAFSLFVTVLTDAGLAEDGWDVEYIAEMMVSGLQAKNFSCIDYPSSTGMCAFHPVVQTVNIRPNELELVVSGGSSSIATEQQLLWLYAVGVPLLIDQLNSGDIDTVTCSEPPSSPGAGTLPLFPQPPKTLP